MSDRRTLKTTVVAAATLESVAVVAFVLAGASLNECLAVAVLLLSLLLSLRFFWQRLSNRDAQLWNLVLLADDPIGDLDKLMLVGHVLAVLVGVTYMLT